MRQLITESIEEVRQRNDFLFRKYQKHLVRIADWNIGRQFLGLNQFKREIDGLKIIKVTPSAFVVHTGNWIKRDGKLLPELKAIVRSDDFLAEKFMPALMSLEFLLDWYKQKSTPAPVVEDMLLHFLGVKDLHGLPNIMFASATVTAGSADRQLVAGPHTTHANAVNDTTASAAVENKTDNTCRGASDEVFGGPQYYLGRGCYAYDTSVLGGGAVVTAVDNTLKYNSTVGDTNNFSTNIFYFTPATPGSFVANDYDNAVGTVACASAKDITGLTGTQTFSLNAGGIASISPTGWSHFSQRLSGDYGPSTPTGTNFIRCSSGSDATSGNRPYLTITYTPPSGGYIFVD